MSRAVFKGALVALLLLSVPAALARASIEFGGWRANWLNGTISIRVDQVGPDFAKIEVFKDFTEPPVGGLFPPRIIDFVQIAPDPNTVKRIIILDETITNLTGVGWTDYHWSVIDDGEAWFNVPLSATFDVTPFKTKKFSDPRNVFNDPNKATDLNAFDGLVPHQDTFFPGLAAGDLVIDVNLAPQAPVSFTFKQFPTPEPSSLMLLSLGALVGWRRRG